jgi:rubrerythrin
MVIISMTQDIQVCNKCGIVFDIQYRANRDCPVCHGGGFTPFTVKTIGAESRI